MPINRQIGVNLAFTADTKQVKQQLQDLKQSLSALTANSARTSPLGLTKEVTEAISGVNKLGIALNNATHQNGKLDLSQFRQEIDKAGLSAEQIANNLNTLGPAGKKAFSELTQSIVNAEVPLKRTSGLLSEFFVTLKNTARWQISSSILHGFMGSVQSAYYYAQDLNESLNNIRIVTGKNTDEMAQFAKEANEAAKALSTTTTAYTDASLIYYQQGLDDEQVKERTDVTIKMANVARESATTVSEQLTAVWNNFAEGGDNLEYYADVMTALGAATASSSAEIAEGLEKFAAAADTVGLSYEYATAALATVTATTRQSADIVGNAFKTLFSRMQGLKLGETLDDGTDLNKYSAALDAVGINIKKVDGELKDMDTILDELGARWQILEKDQKMALAQTVAGVRQYTQLIALMDNWDFFQSNLGVARGAEGTLQEQADIYAESWEAAQKRVQASLEDVYNTLLDDKFFINLTEGFGNFVNQIKNVINALGGVKGVVSLLSTMLISVFSKDLSASLSRTADNIKSLFGIIKKESIETRQEFTQLMQDMVSDGTAFGSAQADIYGTQGQLQDSLINKVEQLRRANIELTSEQEKQVQQLMSINSAIGQEYLESIKVKENLQEEVNLSKMLVLQEAKRTKGEINLGEIETQVNNLGKIQTAWNTLNDTVDRYITSSEHLFDKSAERAVSNIIKNLEELDDEFKINNDSVQELINRLKNLGNINDPKKLNEEFRKITETLEELGAKGIQQLDNLKDKFGDANNYKEISKAIDEYINKLLKLNQAQANSARYFNSFEESSKNLLNIINELNGVSLSTSDKIVGLGQSVASLSLGINQIKGLISTWQDEDLSIFDKLLSSAMSLGFVIPSLVSGFNKFNSILNLSIGATEVQTAATEALKAAEDAEAARKIANNFINKEGIFAKAADATATKLETIAIEKETAAEEANTIAKLKNKLVTLAIVTAIGLLVWATSSMIKKVEEERQARIKENEELIEEINEKQKLVKENQKVYNSYRDLYDQYQKNIISKEELSDVTDQLLEKYDIENGHLYKLTGNYKDLNAAIQEARQSELELAKSGVEDKLKAIEANYSEQSPFKLFNFNDLSFEYVAENYDDIINGTSGLIVSSEQIEQLKELKPLIDQYNESLIEIDDIELQLIENQINLFDVDSIDDFTNKVKDLEEEFSKVDLYSDKNTKDILKQYLSGLNTEYSNLYLAIEEFKEQLGEDILDGFSEEEKKYIFSGAVDLRFVQSKEDIQEQIQKSFENFGTFDVTASVNLATTLASGSKLKKADNKTLEELESQTPSAMAGFDNKSIKHQLETIDEINNYKIQKNEEYLHHYEESLRKEQEQYLEQQKELIASPELYQEKLDRLKELQKIEGGFFFTKENEEELKTLEKEINLYNALGEEIENINEKLKESMSFEEIEDIGFNDLISQIEMTTLRAQELQTAAELIGEGFVVATSDVEKFASMFPELLEGMKILENGSMQLDKDIVQEKIAGVQAEMQARTEARMLEIDQQISLKEAEQKYLQEKLKNLKAWLDGEQTTQTTVSNIQKAGHDYNKDLLDLTGQQIDELENFSIEAASAEGEAYVTMLNEVGAAFAQAAKAHYAMINGEEFDWEPINFSGTSASGHEYASSQGDSSKAYNRYLEDIKHYEDVYNEAQKVQSQLNDVNGELDKLKAERVALESTSKAATHALDNVAAGRAGKDTKDKSKSGGKDKQDKELKKLEEEFDRYWQLKKAIDAVDRAISRLDKDQENLYGYELINSLKQENELLEKQKANYEALAAAQREEAAELQGLLSGYGVAFDASGAITNYAAATSAALAEYNAALAQYNAGLIDESALKVYEKNYEAFKKALDRYETLYYQEMQDTQDKLDEIWRKELANNLKAWDVEVKLKLDMKELKRGWNDFINEIQKDFQKIYQDLRVDVKTLAKDAATYVGDEGTIATIIDAVHDVTGEIDKLRGGGQSDMFESISQAQENLKELNSTLQDSARDMHKLWEDAWQNYLDGIDQVADQFDDLIDRFEKINDELEFQKEIIELLYGPEAYALMSKYYEGQEKNTLEQMRSLKTQKDMWEDLWRASGATMDNQASWTEDQKKYYEQWQEAQSDLNSLVLEYIKLLKEDYMNTVNDILKQLEQGITGSSLSSLETEWERISDYADKYYDSVEGAYEVQKLANRIDQDIAAATNLKAQQKLQALREKEIDYLREKDNLTKYDLDAAEARYQIALKEIALEEARNNKTSMKLTRNEQGNWSYQYIADEENVMTKRQELLDAYAQLYQLASDAYEENLKALQELQQKYLDSAREIYEDETLSEEEKQQKLLELRNWYFDEYARLADENILYRNDLELGAAALLLEIYEQDKDAYEAMTEDERALVDALVSANIDDFMDLEEKLKDNYKDIGDKARETMVTTRQDWTSGAQDLADLWNKDNGSSVKAQVVSAYDRIEQANQSYQNKVDECARIVERDFSEEGIAGAIQRAEDETDNLRYKTEELVASAIPYLNELKYYVDMIADAWKSVQQAILDAIELIEEYLKYVGEANRAAQEQAAAAANAAAQAASNKTTANKGNQNTSKTPEEPNPRIYSGSYQGNDSIMVAALGGTTNAGQKGQVTIEKQEAWTDWMHQSSKQEETWTDRARKTWEDWMSGYATGGYTGTWNNGSSDGRLAVLHQKELVLNESDTKNFLSGINTLRDMSAVNGSISDSIARAIANTIVDLGQRKTGVITTATNNSSSTENYFNITAEFPNASNVDDIREAILSLPNIASQYIASNNK